MVKGICNRPTVDEAGLLGSTGVDGKIQLAHRSFPFHRRDDNESLVFEKAKEDIVDKSPEEMSQGSTNEPPQGR